MRITEGQLRRVIREELISEAPATPDTVPDDVMFRLWVTGRGGGISVTAFKNGRMFGQVDAYRYEDQETPCLGAYEVTSAKSEIKGFGPLMYDILMEMATYLGGPKSGLMSDRWSVTPYALNVWQKYQDERSADGGDVKRIQLDNPKNERTPEIEDNCNVILSVDAVGDAWHEYPLSGVYRKPGMKTIRSLLDLGKLKVEGIKL